MKKTLNFALIFASLLCATPSSFAAGCLKGAAVGAAIGHIKHHAVMGAIGGCVVGHHMANAAKQGSAEPATK